VKNKKQQNQAIARILNNLQDQTYECNGLDQRGVASLIENQTQRLYRLQETFEYSEPESVRSIDDFTLSIDDQTYLIDVKTHDKDRDFSMPNLISTERLYKLYQDPNITFGIAIIDYRQFLNSSSKQITNTKYVPIENISWESLSIQNLGHGQIQITNLNKNIKPFNGTRKQWMNAFTVEMIKYHDKLEAKLKQRKQNWIERSAKELLTSC
tara:strand:+ start:477 stop:1109 length:633 start_codon:yes stop_codon:yes gene_type:complete